jgi:hypothetical protein
MFDRATGSDEPVTGRGKAGRSGRSLVVMSVVAVTAAALASGTGFAGAQGAGGTAKPPAKGLVAANPVVNLADPAFSANVNDIHGFDMTGFIKDATVYTAGTVDPSCPTVTDPSHFGGTVTVNGIKITIPCNLIIQMPANTYTWADFMKGPKLDLNSGASPSFEMRLVGNVVGGPNSPGKPAAEYIAGLAFASQQGANTGTGVISKIDYSTGNIIVDAGASTVNGPNAPVVIQLNDPTGEFGRVQSPDARFSVDNQNPTVHAGTGYPMCVPRTDPTVAGGDDALCPQGNRPKPVNGVCNNFNLAVLPKGGLLPGPGPKQVYCSQWVMGAAASANGDPSKQAPFEVGDNITWSGTLIPSKDPTIPDLISAHTVEAQVGIYTAPGTKPSYLAIGSFGIGSADTALTAVSGVAQEGADRIFLEAETTDVQTPVDIYMTDTDAKTGAVHNRWVTPWEMTGENQLGTPPGGINTQFTGVQSQRIRLRAAKAPVGLLNQPSRNVRVVSRTLCTPQPFTVVDQAVQDACINNAPKVANGLQAGEYTAPTFEYIFPENVHQGDAIVPFDLWHLPALALGENTNNGGVGALIPTPW